MEVTRDWNFGGELIQSTISLLKLKFQSTFDYYYSFKMGKKNQLTNPILSQRWNFSLNFRNNSWKWKQRKIKKRNYSNSIIQHGPTWTLWPIISKVVVRTNLVNLSIFQTWSINVILLLYILFKRHGCVKKKEKH